MCLSAPIVTLLIATAGTVGEKAETAISLCNVLFVGNLCASFVVLGFFGTRSIGDSLRALPGRVRLEMLVFISLAALLSSMIFTALASSAPPAQAEVEHFLGIFEASFHVIALLNLDGRDEVIGQPAPQQILIHDGLIVGDAFLGQ